MRQKQGLHVDIYVYIYTQILYIYIHPYLQYIYKSIYISTYLCTYVCVIVYVCLLHNYMATVFYLLCIVKIWVYICKWCVAYMALDDDFFCDSATLFRFRTTFQVRSTPTIHYIHTVQAPASTYISQTFHHIATV